MENLIVLQTQFKFFLPCIYESGFESGIQNQNNTETILYISTINKENKKKTPIVAKEKTNENFSTGNNIFLLETGRSWVWRSDIIHVYV